MHYLIDGHNLIGKLPQISLDDPDDEVKLVLLLRRWTARKRGRRVTVYFDQGLPGGLEKGLSTGQVKVVFAPMGRTADSLLLARLGKVKNPAEFTLVTSDQQVIEAAARQRVPLLRAEEFATSMEAERLSRQQQDAMQALGDSQLSPDEVAMWLALFGEKAEDKTPAPAPQKRPRRKRPDS